MYVNSEKCFFSQRICGSKQRFDPVHWFRWTKQPLLAGWISWAYNVSSCYFRRKVGFARFLDVFVCLLDYCVIFGFFVLRDSVNFRYEVTVRDWSKSIGEGGWAGTERGWVISFWTFVRGGSFNFQLPLRGGSSCFFVVVVVVVVFFFNGDWHAFDNKGNSFQTVEASDTLEHQPGSGSHGQLFLPY